MALARQRPWLKAGLFEVQVALDQPLDLLADLALVAQPEHRGALGLDQLPPDLAEAHPLLLQRFRRLLAPEHRHALTEARAIEVAQAP